jgi:hypothetical protein
VSKQLHLVESGILTINPEPSRWHIWAAFAHPIALSESEFIAMYQRGEPTLHLLPDGEPYATW